MQFNIKSIVLGMIVATACLALLLILYAPFQGVEIPNDIKVFVFGIITLAIGGGGGATLWQAAERRGEIKGEINASNALVAQGLGVRKK